jgi:membrane-associated phospholipid phosphatase
MPSLHLATMFWSIIAVRKTRWLPVAWAVTAFIFIGSIAIGWHYAMDGIVGGLGAVLCYWLAGVRTAEIITSIRKFSRFTRPPATSGCPAESEAL